MKACKLTITTTADGVENTVTRDGEMELSIGSVQLRYREENAFVVMILKGESAEIQREGDYSLRLYLKRGELSQGTIGIGGANGEIQTFTHRVSYSVSKDSLLLSLHYDLLISGEKQVMKLRLLSRFMGDHL